NGRGLCRGRGENWGVAGTFKKKRGTGRVCGGRRRRARAFQCSSVALRVQGCVRVEREREADAISYRAAVVTVFFFSSRRRHTRFDCDWSSDVCSSDRSEEHTSELQSQSNLVCRLLLEFRRVLFR